MNPLFLPLSFSHFISLFKKTDVSPPSIFHIPADHVPDKQLTDWLKEQGADADTVDKVEYLAAFEILPLRLPTRLVFLN